MSTNEPPPEETPPPTGGYGESPPPPPPPAPGGYGGPPPPAPGEQWDLGSALSYGWQKFTDNLAQVLFGVLVLVGIFIVAGAIAFGFIALLTTNASCTVDNSTGALSCDDGSGWIWRLIVNAIAIGFLYVVGQIVGAGIIRGVLGITEGRTFQVSEMFKTEGIGPVVVASLIVGVATTIGYALCYVPGVVIAFLTSYTLFFVIDKGLAPIDAIRASFELIKDNLGNAILWYIVGGLVAVAGVIACGVGLLVTIPVVVIGTAYTYKKFTGARVAA